MSCTSAMKVAVLTAVLMSPVSAQSSSSEPSFTAEILSNTTTSISSTLRSSTNYQNSTLLCTTCSLPPRSLRTASPPSLTTPIPSAESTTSTIYTTYTYTITACPPSIPNCPVGHLTTESIPLYITICPIGKPLRSLPVGPPGTDHPIYSSFILPPGALPVPTYKDGIPDTTIAVTNAGRVGTTKPLVPTLYPFVPVVVPSKDARPGSNSTLPAPISISASYKLVTAVSSTNLDQTSKIADGIVVTKTVDGVAASTGLSLPSNTSCAGPTCTEWISGGVKRVAGGGRLGYLGLVFGVLVVVLCV